MTRDISENFFPKIGHQTYKYEGEPKKIEVVDVHRGVRRGTVV